MTGSRRPALLLAIALLVLLPWHRVFAAEIVMTSPYWAGFTSPDGRGLYHDLMRAVFALRGDTVRHLEAPAKRGLVLLREGQADVYTCRTEAGDGLELGGLPMYEGEFHALFLRRTFPDWRGPASMANRRLVWRLGYYLPDDFPVPVRYDETTTGIEALKRVVRGSADFYIDDFNLIAETVNEYPGGLEAQEYRIESVGFRPYYPVFAASRRGRELRQAFEDGMRTLAEQGRLRPIYERWNLPVPRAFQP